MLIAENMGDAISTISLSTEKASPVSCSPHTGFIYFPFKRVDFVASTFCYIFACSVVVLFIYVEDFKARSQL